MDSQDRVQPFYFWKWQEAIRSPINLSLIFNQHVPQMCGLPPGAPPFWGRYPVTDIVKWIKKYLIVAIK